MTTSRRLLEHFIPTHYTLSLDIDRLNRTYEGTVTITGISAADGPLYLHAQDIEIVECRVDDTVIDHSINEQGDLKLDVTSTEETEYSLTISFKNTITDSMHGMYPCYFKHDGQTKELIATQFESHHAREVFPCIDEPAAKATFDVTLTTEPDITVLANMPIAEQHDSNGRLVTTFMRTPKMSSYLLAWVYGELHKKTATTKHGVEVNVWATPAQPTESLDFSLDIAVRTIDFFDDYFDTPYPLPKSDHVALPDFSSGAMENWGLITYREMALLADPKHTSVSAKHYIATVVAHELAHQWFGNLVTMQWWNDLWLNESFATLMEYIAIDKLEPDWNVWLDFASNETVMALRRDAIDGVQAVQVDVRHPDEISTLFDSAIVYAKGARLLRMLETYVGKQAFQTGLQSYFETHAYSNTEADDLWNALTKSSGKDIHRFMNTWISQSGYPVVTFGDDTLSQQQFFIGNHEPSTKLWPIPLGASDPSVPALLEANSIRTDAAIDTRLNTTDSAHFITRYAEHRLSAILEHITAAEPLARLQLLHEQSLLARGGYLSSAQLIPLLRGYQSETTESVWDIIALTFSELKKFVDEDSRAETSLRRFAATLAKSRFEALGWDKQVGESESDTKLRATVLSMMLYSEDSAVVSEALRLFSSTPIEELDGETRGLILASAIKHDESDGVVTMLFNTYTNTGSSDLKADICSGLTATKSAQTALRLLNLTKDASVIKQQDVFRWFVYLIRNRHTRDTAWQWLKDNWSWIEATFKGDKSYDDYPRYAASGLSTREQQHDYETFFGPMKQETALNRAITLGLAEIDARVSLIERDADAVRAALNTI